MLRINQWLKSRNDLENIILIIAVIALGVGVNIYYQEHNAAAWENKMAECNQLSKLSTEAMNNEVWDLSTNLFDQSMKCMRELN
jgi:uncharacterized protein HemX